MIDLTRTIYTTSGRNPAELLDGTRFPDQSSVEHHLFEAFVHVAYDSRSAAPGSQPGSAPARYSTEPTGDWLRFLAVHLNRSGDHNLAWWRLEDAISRPTRGLVAGLVSGLAFGITQGLFFGAAIGLAYAVILGVTVGFAGTFGRTRRPSRIGVRFRGKGGPLFRRLIFSITLGLAWIPADGVAAAVFGTVLYSVVLTIHMWLDDPPDEASAADPVTMLKQDRGATLGLGAMFVFVFGMSGVLIFAGPLSGDLGAGPGTGIVTGSFGVSAAAFVGAMLGGFLYGRVGAVAFGIAGAGIGWLTIITGYITAEPASLAYEISLGLTTGGLAILSRAWGAFALTKLYLALRGRLPLRLMRFLDDAHQRGILRQSGTVYQFRHRALQEWLAGPRPDLDAHPKGDQRSSVRFCG